MGMTIEDTISDLTELKICGVVPFTKGTISGGNYKVITEECLDTAIATMRKYQKIVDIVSLSGEEFKQCGLKELKEILEVIADGRT